MARRRGRRIRVLGMRFRFGTWTVVAVTVLAFVFIAPVRNMVMKLFGKTPA